MWYPHGMRENAEYRVCDGSGEDMSCAVKGRFAANTTSERVTDHLIYFDKHVGLYCTTP